MKTIQISKAEGAALDWLVAKCEDIPLGPRGFVIYRDGDGDATGYAPSTDWSQGGPIIEREKIALSQFHTAENWLSWSAQAYAVKVWAHGWTPLAAAMRCYCISKMGATAEVPEELL